MRERYFLGKGIVNYILTVGDNMDGVYISRISKYTKMTYAHTFKITKYLTCLGIIRTSKKGIVRKVELTEKGLKIYNLLSEIFSISDNIS